MHWLRSHPYAASLAGAGILILLGALIVAQRTSVRGEGTAPRAWGGVGANLLNPVGAVPSQFAPSQENLYTQVRSGPPFYYSPTSAQIPQTQAGTAEDFNLDEFLTMLSHPPTDAGSERDDSLLETAYSFIPGGFISTSSPTRERTSVQQALFNYGNEVGSDIQSFEEIYRNAPQILKDQFEDRSNPAKNNALLSLANGLSGVGRALLAMEEVPSQVASAHKRLAASYQAMGEELSKIPGATNDQALLDAILAYNATVETFTKNYVALATLFSTYGVTFSADDPGSVFVFSSQAGF